MLTDPILTGYLANLGSELTGAVITALRRRAEEFALGTPKYQSLKRCYAAAEAVLLPPGDPLAEAYRPHLAEFLADRAMASEFSKLVKGRSPDWETIGETLAEFAAEHGLPVLDLTDRLNAAVKSGRAGAGYARNHPNSPTARSGGRGGALAGATGGAGAAGG